MSPLPGRSTSAITPLSIDLARYLERTGAHVPRGLGIIRHDVIRVGDVPVQELFDYDDRRRNFFIHRLPFRTSCGSIHCGVQKKKKCVQLQFGYSSTKRKHGVRCMVCKKKKKIRPASVRVLLNNEEAWCANTCLFAVHLGSEMKFWSTNK